MDEKRKQDRLYANNTKRVNDEATEDLPLKEGERENYNENRLAQIKFPK
ncbi:hypothetical protein [Vallitalea okinawensis]|nr:hypothetical protein [Vallitalea okinawensis]